MTDTTNIITEDLEYSDEFAKKILESEQHGNFREIDVDALLGQLDQMIIEAEAASGKGA